LFTTVFITKTNCHPHFPIILLLKNYIIRQTASHKATGPDEVPAEVFKAGGDSTGQNAENAL